MNRLIKDLCIYPEKILLFGEEFKYNGMGKIPVTYTTLNISDEIANAFLSDLCNWNLCGTTPSRKISVLSNTDYSFQVKLHIDDEELFWRMLKNGEIRKL